MLRKYRGKHADELGLPLAGRMWSRVCCISMAINGSRKNFSLNEWLSLTLCVNNKVSRSKGRISTFISMIWLTERDKWRGNVPRVTLTGVCSCLTSCSHLKLHEQKTTSLFQLWMCWAEAHCCSISSVFLCTSRFTPTPFETSCISARARGHTKVTS